ncbi:lipid-binding protein [Salegentibacter salinarum]|uniref:Lipid-binding protein n=1 Tax=Salegentibacter salinarum TaxID=447422 RepID=A0A2N0TTX7_9FLAO|nr:YceI family protein [Salegentibacter salinarum]PKD18189.1 lipid-binding protein [Salegentibacter salinarum]SKB42692.1 Polyisoprenoid-binding protein YceI [Salegentibacter salinarum]
MRKSILSTFVIAAFLTAVVGCKNDKNKAETSEAKDAATAQAEAMEFTVDTSASTIEWRGSKPTGEHTGTIKLTEGTFSANDSIIESGNFVINMQSITVTDLEGDDKKDLEAHLMGTVEGKEGDFFNATKYPEATFEVTEITEENGQKMLSGNLTIKEETKNVSFPVNINQSDDSIEITSEEFTIDRTNWNVNFGSKSVFDGLGDNFVSDDITLKVNLKATKA